MRSALIFLHSVAGVVAIGTGYSLLDRPRASGMRAAAHVFALTVLLVCLFGAIAADWSTLEPGARIGFCALGALATFMVMRAERARRGITSGPIDVVRFSQDIGFTLVGLIDGFVVVFALGVGMPTIGLVVLGVGIAVAGHLLIRDHERRLRSQATPWPEP